MSSTIHGKVIQGDDFSESFTLSNSITGVAPTPDLATVEVLIKSDLADADASALEELDSGTEITIDDANLWTITITMTDVQSLALAVGRHKWVCTTIDVGGLKQEAFRGDFVVVQRGSNPSD